MWYDIQTYAEQCPEIFKLLFNPINQIYGIASRQRLNFHQFLDSQRLYSWFYLQEVFSTPAPGYLYIPIYACSDGLPHHCHTDAVGLGMNKLAMGAVHVIFTSLPPTHPSLGKCLKIAQKQSLVLQGPTWTRVHNNCPWSS